MQDINVVLKAEEEKDILTTVLKIAEMNGYKFPRYEGDERYIFSSWQFDKQNWKLPTVLMFYKGTGTSDFKSVQRPIYEFIYTRDFIKAFWPHGSTRANNKHWKFYLEQMVKSRNLIQYLKKFL